jgi:predicted nucleic acid-binding protein
VIIVVDANIIISAIIDSSGTIGDLLINSAKHFEFIAPELLETEVRKSLPKLSKLTGAKIISLIERQQKVMAPIEFISDLKIHHRYREKAQDLLQTIDPEDEIYLSLAFQYEALLWTGDKRLIRGLRRKQFRDIVTTAELSRIRGLV